MHPKMMALLVLVIACEDPGGIQSTGDLPDPTTPEATEPTATREAPTVQEVECETAEDDDAIGQVLVQVDDPRTHAIPRIEVWQQKDLEFTDNLTQIPMEYINPTTGEARFFACVAGVPVYVWTYPY